MPALSREEIGLLLNPYLFSPSEAVSLESYTELLDQLSIYLDLLLKWNGRMNLTSIRDPGEIVRRHFGESLFAARHVSGQGTLLDLGSGAGFPGLPIQLLRPDLSVTLAESQAKKSAFLREAIRVLTLRTEVWAARAETLLPARRFDAVILRAVDDPIRALGVALKLTRGDVWLLASTEPSLVVQGDAEIVTQTVMPGADASKLIRLRRAFHVEQ